MTRHQYLETIDHLQHAGSRVLSNLYERETMTSVEYRGHRIKKVSKRNSNLKWQVRFPGDEDPIRFRTKADAIEFIEIFEQRKTARV